jgi:long-chain acyl-CoA synthetase
MSRNVLALFEERVRLSRDRVAYRLLRAAGAAADETLSWEQWSDRSDAVAAALVRAGHRPGEVAAVLAGNRVLWPVAEIGILRAGMISAGLYPTSAPAQVQQILADSGATVAFADTTEQLAKIVAVASDLPRLHTVVFDDGGSTATRGAQVGASAGAAGPEVVSWAEWLAGGRAALGDEAIGGEVRRRAEAPGPDDTAILIYTSGSTGVPKGACIPHRYLLASADSVRDALGLTEADTSLSFLPFCHAAERIFGLYTRIRCGNEACLVPDVARVWDAARAFGPTLFGGLPRFYEKVFEALQAEREDARGAERECWETVLELGRLRSRLLRTGASVPPGHLRRWEAEGTALFEAVRERFGGRMRLATSGGAALPVAVAEFLDALGVTVLGAYGLTEHLCVAFNRPGRYAFDGVGPPMLGTDLRIADDGEILVRRSDLTFAGYLGRPDDTRETFSADGRWLLTGDLGSLDSQGVLHVTGRKKELIALSTGKKVAPLPIERRLGDDPGISHVMLYGEGRKYITALICLRRPVVEAWARQAGHAGTGDARELIRIPAVQARVQAAIDRVNADLSRTEQIRRQVVLLDELSVENDELTPTMKLRRAVVVERYRDHFEALYAEPL